MTRYVVLFLLLSAVALNEKTIVAGPIPRTSFGPNATDENFDGLGLNSAPVANLVNVNGVTFATSAPDGQIRWSAFSPTPTGASGQLFGTDASDNNTSMTLFLPSGARRAGLDVTGFAEDPLTMLPWTVQVEFFSAASVPLGTMSPSASTRGMIFAGWESLNTPIASIKITDTDTNGRILAIDDLVYELVPEPGSLMLILFGTLMLFERRSHP